MSEGTEQVRWLVIAPTGGVSGVFAPGSHVNGILAETPVEVSMGGVTRPVQNLRDLTLKAIVANDEGLRDATAAAENLPDAPEEKSLEGMRNVPELAELLDEASQASAAKAEGSAASLAVSSFIHAVRGGESNSQRRKAARGVRDAVEAYTLRLAGERLAEAESVESNLRGLDLLLRACTSGSQIAVEVLDAPISQAAELLQARADADQPLPDAIFVAGAPKELAELASIAEGLAVPLLFDAAEDLVSVDEHSGEYVVSPEWEEVRASDASRWLCAIHNRVVLFSEGAGEASRTVLGAGTWAVAAQLSQSYAKSGSFAMILGRPGALRAPGVQRIDDLSIPTERFSSIRDQTQLAACGLLSLGSGRTDDRVTLSVAPTAHASGDALPLAGQILTGRIVRFAWWVLDQVPAESDAETIKGLFEDAARVFLFPGMQDQARLEASAVEREDGSRAVRIEVAASGAAAGCPLELDFELPL